MSHHLRSRIGVALSVLLLLFVIVGPFYYVFTSSIKSPQEIIARTPTLIPHSFTLEHYEKLLRSSAFPGRGSALSRRRFRMPVGC